MKLKTGLYLIILFLSFGSCKKTENTESETNSLPDEEESTELVSKTISEQSGGIEMYLQSYTTQAQSQAMQPGSCGLIRDSSVSLVKNGWTANYNVRSFLLCDSVRTPLGAYVYKPSKMVYTLVGASDYSGPVVNSKDSMHAILQVSGFDTSSTWKAILDFNRKGLEQRIALKKSKSFTSQLNINSSNIVLDKSTMRIKSGNVSLSLNLAANGYPSITRNASVVFIGNQSAVITWANGGNYTITW